ncbi:lactosylceramide 4-alpha-galactosyltransferase-like [Sitophilus oryzae]|uniref:Lactosylceramide 4-alpha-galactosyltransferase-like n=1 Tax=Sitophilus oryzae TaxID=7048 RepID=A0A6J2XKC3_SITOR|nr:lactosylceramide 4-alpha-galactosyltransferase-like [Sitophilus oryzae]
MVRKVCTKNACIVILICIIIYCLMKIRTIAFYKQYHKIVEPTNPVFCYSLNVVDKLRDIQDTEVLDDMSIFFLDTSCNSFSNGKLVVTPRQACAVESAAVMNPNRIVYLLFASPGIYLTLFRLLLLWKYGGIYMDLDVIVIKSLESLPNNFAAAESGSKINNDVIGFSKKGVGHDHVQVSLEDLSDKYKGDSWTGNGPDITTTLAKRLCNTGDVSKMAGQTCKDFQIYPSNTFYPISWQDWESYFNPDKMDHVMEKIKDSYVVHVWNKLSKDKRVHLYEESPYLKLAREYCPETVRNLEEAF